MKQTLLKTFMLATAFAMSIGAWAQTEEVVFDFTQSTNDYRSGITPLGNKDLTEGETTFTNSNVTIKYAEKGGTTNLRWWSDGIRAYNGNIFTIEAADAEIERIQIEGTITIVETSETGGSISSNTWTQPNGGSVSSVSFKGNHTSKNKTITKVTVTLAAASDPSDESVATTVTIDATKITNTDIYGGTNAGALTATVSVTDGDEIAGASVTWSSNDEGIVTIDNEGNVTLVAEGTTTLKANYAGEEGKYKASSATYQITVTDTDPNKPGTESNPYTVAQAIAFINTLNGATSSTVYVSGIVSQIDNYNGTYHSITYWISDDGTTEGQMEVYSGKGLDGADFGAITDLRLGDQVTVSGNVKLYNGSIPEFDKSSSITSFYRDETQPVNICTLNSITPTNIIVGASGEFEISATFVDEDLVEGNDYEFTLTSSDTSILEITGNTYEAKAAGEVTITVHVTVLDDEKYNEVEEEFTIIVKEPAVAYTFAPVKDITALTDGCNVIIVNSEAAVAISTEQKTNNRGQTDLTFNGDNAIVELDGYVQIFTVEEAEDGCWYFNTGAGYIYAASSSSNNLRTEEEKDDNAKAEITIDDNGNASIVFQGSNTRNSLFYNSGSSLFSCYANTSSQKPVQIYTAVTAPATVSEAGYATFSSTQALDFTNVKNIEAYTATVEGSLITFTRIQKVPANTGVLLRSVDGGEATAQVPVLTMANAVDDNVFVAVSEDIDELATTVEGNTNYILQASPEVGFYLAAGNAVDAGKAYISVETAANVKGFQLPGSNTTAVQTVRQNNVNSNVIFNIAGQRVSRAQKGIYVIGGKKVVK